jgi:N6-adenosine-specific RNA methylase IME4
LLIGTRGNIPCPAPGTQFDSVIEAARGAHSAKPVIVREMIAAMFPTLPKLEMFARGQRVDGWDFWGNEVDEGVERNKEEARDA